MRIKILTLALFTAFVAQVNAQSVSTPYIMADLALGANPSADQYVGALSVVRSHPLFKGKLHLGYGLRANLLSASNQTYITAPFEFTADEKIDTGTIGSVSTASISASINIGYSITEKLMLGFNIDAIGVSFGGEQDFTFTSLDDGSAPFTTKASPTSTNFLLVGDNDIGTLNSEFFVRYMVGSKLGLRGGFSFFFSEYTTDQVGSNNNNRYRNKLGYPFLAVSLKL